MSLGVYPVGVYHCDLDPSGTMQTPTLVATHPHYEVNFKEFATFCLRPLDGRHNQPVKSFEVKLNCTGNCQIGWVHPNYMTHTLSQAKNGTQGVGYGSSSLSYDVVRGGMVLSGSFQEVPNASVKSSSVIRCDEQGKAWYIDGKLIASTQKRDNAAQISTGSLVGTSVPCISMRGKVEFISIEFLY